MQNNLKEVYDLPCSSATKPFKENKEFFVEFPGVLINAQFFLKQRQLSARFEQRNKLVATTNGNLMNY